MAAKILLAGESADFKKRFRRVFSMAREFDVLEVPADQGRISLEQLSQVELVCFAGSTKSQDWQDLKLVRSTWAWLPVITMRDGDLVKDLSTEVLVRNVGLKTPPKLVISLAHKLISHSHSLRLSEKRVEAASQGGGLATDFFGTLDIHEVLGKTLDHFGNKILCQDIHWIQWREIEHLATVDGESLDLEVETKYHLTPRLRSWIGQGGVKNVVDLARAFPLKEQLSHLEQGGFLIQKSGGALHLLFPLKGSLDSSNLSCLLIEDLHDGEPDFIVDMMRSALTHLSKHIEFAYKYYEATNRSYIDDLTDLYNQRYLPKVLDGEISRASRQDSQFSVLFLDVDHFKQVNDSNGHWIGSKLLVELGKIIRDSIRSCDFGFRYGGDEYVVVLVDTCEQEAKKVAERLRSSIEQSTFLIDGCRVQLTVSIGLACFPGHAQTSQDIIKLADEAMYVGKNKSRNIIVVAS